MTNAELPELPELPPPLCRFRTYGAEYKNGKDKTGVYELLAGRLHFKNVNSFNDPFEGRPQLIPEFPDPQQQRDAMIEAFAAVLRRQGVKSPRRTAETTFEGRTIDEIFESMNRKTLPPMQGEVLVLCLSDSRAAVSPLSWAHYADSHKGVCVDFDSSLAPIGYAGKIIYSAEYPCIRMPGTTMAPWEIAQVTYLRKCDQWAYEQEYRVMRFKLADPRVASRLDVDWDGDTAIADPQIVKSVTLGARMDPALRTELTEWTKANVPHVEVWQAELHRSRYEVLRRKIS